MGDEHGRGVNGSRPHRVGGDLLSRVLVVAIALVLLAIVTILLYAVTAGVFARPAPRTYAEQQLDMLALVIEQQPASADAWADYARALIAAEQLNKAEAILSRADEIISTGDPGIMLEWARLSLALGDEDDALARIDAAIQAALGKRQAEIKRMGTAGIVPDPRAIERDTLFRAYILRARIYGTREEWALAAIYEEPSSADALVMRGEAYLELGQTGNAVADFEQALQMVPDLGPALDGLKRAGGGEGQ
jgi:tetratricopeptide (TPR) repeat protein